MGEFDQRLNNRLAERKKQGLYRKLKTMNTAPGPRVDINGEKQLVFSSNNYLGLANDQRLINAAKATLDEFGVGSSGSRLTTGNSIWHERLEEKVAQFKQTEAALLFSNGYLANVGVLSSLPEKGDVILSDQLNHASIIDGCRLSKADTMIYNHVDMIDLEKKLKEERSYQRRFIVTDGVFSMDGNIAPLDKIMTLASRYGASVIVDDAHATGVLGKHGRGTSEYFGIKPDVIIGTLSKAVGTEGGYVAGSKTLVDFLLNYARPFIFQTAISPASCAASSVAFDVIESSMNKRESLVSKVQYLKMNLQELGYHVIGGQGPIVPVIIGESQKAVSFADRLREKAIYAPAIRPPTVSPSESRIRLTLTSDHTDEEIDYLIEAFRFIGEELKVIT
ncbi:8-amino-7-oxononanoate synthase [Alteribacter populi]|uniref:8-amino-7-oxononanoate synthase n=1 Tax=Alteribacter populi TaxID=2011011 RepID=UPI000BBB1374|nr:8-amino-7-oxononanoate synthase [Alteribacter populi]